MAAATFFRRSFLKAGVAGAVALALTGGLYRLTSQPAATVKFVLDDAAKAALAAIIPVVLKDAVEPGSPGVQLAMERVQGAIAGLPLRTQKEVRDLFALLTLAPTRRILAGIPDDWPNAKQDDIATFLQSWRVHRIEMLQSAYHALHDLITGPWYADESNWASIGYPGPLKELS
ncbi:hypothetical protein [Noviherbaspirillum sp. UKPF54]|uniref:hypothetical protein n=1 Tax=Noviherbaspirillum sp. UKPF54 TaxID=2601898 RepID=UPI0011B153C7|nr:hypothetical protein [Noviherbaspirillum sp. UKPF54]QDZ28262.1 hypothetical protein FAY22_10100 [Noviherbaspirillum sp. UKPF54]